MQADTSHVQRGEAAAEVAIGGNKNSHKFSQTKKSKKTLMKTENPESLVRNYNLRDQNRIHPDKDFTISASDGMEAEQQCYKEANFETTM